MQILRQSWRSNYCAVYSTAMMLSIAQRVSLSREAAWRLFGLTREARGRYRGASLADVRRVLASRLRSPDVRWSAYQRFGSRAFTAQLLRQLRAGATLLSFDAISNTGVRGLHVVVITGMNDQVLECMDPLGSGKRCPNVSIDAGTGRVHGAGYAVDITRRGWLLRRPS